MSYGVVAVNAAKDAVRGKLSPVDTWKIAVCKEYPDSKESQKKGCPKSAFLGLCSNGSIQNIPGGDYAKLGLNAIYAIKAAEILKLDRTTTFTPIQLWKAVLHACGADINKAHNSQMNVVLSLWNEQLIN